MTIQTLRDFFVGGLLRRIAPHMQKRLDLANAYRRVFDSAEGQIVLRDICNFAGVLNIDTELSAEEALERCARRAVGLHVLGRLAWSEAELAKLGQEITYETVMGLEREAAAA